MGTPWKLPRPAGKGRTVPRGTDSGIDLGSANVARVYDALAGGHDNFAADRNEAARLLEARPGLRAMARENRAFLERAITWAAGQGIGQYIDLGTGLPLRPAVHESARAVIPGARVAYIDNDPVVYAHVEVLLAVLSFPPSRSHRPEFRPRQVLRPPVPQPLLAVPVRWPAPYFPVQVPWVGHPADRADREPLVVRVV
jgi:hypothetical protein